RILLLLHRFAPVPRRESAILLPAAAAQLERAGAVPRDPEQAQDGRFVRAVLRQRVLPPQTVDAGDEALALDGVPALLVGVAYLGGSRRLAVADGGQTEKVARELRAAGMEDEGAAHSERSSEEPGLEHHVVTRRGLRRSGGGGWCAGARPVVAGEYERSEVHFTRELEQALECRRPRSQGRRPWVHSRDVLESPGEGVEQLLLLS